jgi:hypothetical protein
MHIKSKTHNCVFPRKANTAPNNQEQNENDYAVCIELKKVNYIQIIQHILIGAYQLRFCFSHFSSLVFFYEL